jgi:hypothetical protein
MRAFGAMGFFQTLLESPRKTPLSRYTTWNGGFYLANARKPASCVCSAWSSRLSAGST